MGMGRVWESKLELGSHPFLGKWVFDFLGKKMLGKACPSHCSSISLALSRIGELLCVSLHGLADFSVFPMVGNLFLVLLNVCAAEKSFLGSLSVCPTRENPFWYC